uniref:Keratocan n=1 Tax=Gouania willdenowi TaxID=441366 RepID=A0A8C5GZC2_GOUWI
MCILKPTFKVSYTLGWRLGFVSLMARLLNTVFILCLVGLVLTQDMKYEEFMTQIQACPKECTCPLNFPRAVYCDNKGLKSIPNIPPHTWYLYLQNNLIEVLSAEALRNKGVLGAMNDLIHLYIDDNLLTSVPSPLPVNLENLSLSRNRISKIPVGVFSQLNKLNLLDLQSNKLMDDAVTEVSLKGLTNLVQINLAKNQLSTMPIGLPATTTQLYLDGNNIEKIPAGYFKGLPRVAFLSICMQSFGPN